MRHTIAVTLVIALVLTACTSTTDSSPDGPTTTVDGPTDPSAEPPTTTTPDDPEPPTTRPDGSDLTCWAAEPGGGSGLAWSDQTAATGLIDPLAGMHGHAAAWGDFNGDLIPDVMVGTFADRRTEVYAVRGATGPAPDRVLLGTGDGFTEAGDFPVAFGRASGATSVDLDLDGDLDLVVSRNVSAADQAPTQVYENRSGSFVAAAQTIDPSIAGRSVAVLHIDGDPLPDLVILEDRYRGQSSRALRNVGELGFEDAGASWNFPTDVHGLGVATGDLNRDGHSDLVVAGSNRIFFGTGDGLREVDASAIAWEPAGGEDDVAGAAIADVNNDGTLDLVLGHHFNSTLGRGGPQPVRLFLNQTSDGADQPALVEVTEAAGLVPLPTKAPHVEFADLNNDGLVDVLTSASSADGTQPAAFINTGISDGVPEFRPPDGLGAAQYWVTAPTADYDRDGRLDVLAVEWEPTIPSILFRNESASGAWLEVSLDPSFGAGVGTRIEVFGAGGALLGTREITASQGYAAGAQLVAHFGLGDAEVVTVVLDPVGADPVTVSGVEANRHVRLPGGCG